MNKYLPVFLFLMFYFSKSIFASGFTLNSISGIDTAGKLYKHWWFTGLQPTFSGNAPGSSAIDIIVDGVAYQTASNAADAWQFTVPNALSAGDHSVSLKNNGTTIDFTLTLGSNVDTSKFATSSGQSLPVSGFETPLVLLISLGLLLILAPRIIAWSWKR